MGYRRTDDAVNTVKQAQAYAPDKCRFLLISSSLYILYNTIESASTGVATAQAVYYTASTGVYTEGFVVRQESVIPAGYDLVLPTKAEGEKVAAGEQVALSFRTTAALERQEEIQALENSIQQLETALGYQTSLTDGDAVAQRIIEMAAEFSAQTARGSLDAAVETGSTLKSLVLRQSAGAEDDSILRRQISQLETQLAQISAGTAGDTVTVTASQAGYYSAVCDGYETLLSPEYLETVTPDEFQSLWEQDLPQAPTGTAGRLIDSPRWYYATLVEKDYLEDIQRGQTLTVVLGGEVNRELEMTVTRADRSGTEYGLLVLSSDWQLFDVSAQRVLQADVIFRSYAGLRVPKEAVCYSEESGSAGVYVLVSGKAVWKNVELLYDNGENYIAALDQSSTENLWPEDLILLDTRELYDGKVVEDS